MPPDIIDLKHLATALKLSSKLDTIDRLARDWIEEGMREKKPEDFEDASDRRKWYDLRDSWERVNNELRRSVDKFISETGYSPILRYAREEDHGKVFLGFNTAQAKGYRIVEVYYRQWFEDLNLQTENMSENDVLNLVSILRLSDEEERVLRESFVEDLRQAGVEKFAEYMVRYASTIDRRKTYNENVLRVDNLIETIKHERTLAIPTPTPLAIPEKPPERPPAVPEKRPVFELKAYWGKSPRDLTALWHELYENGKIRIRGHREMRAKPRTELSKDIAEDLRSTIEEAGLSPLDLARERSDLIEKLLDTLPSDLLLPAPAPVPAPAKISRPEFDRRFNESLDKWNKFNIELLRSGLAGEIHYTVPEREAELVAKFTPAYINLVGKVDVDAQRETSWKTYNESYDRLPKYGEFYLQHLDDIVHTLSRNVADKAFRAIIEEAKTPVAPPPAPLGLSEEQKKSLEDAFRRVFEEAGIKDIPMSTFRNELERLQEDLKTVERPRAYELAYRTIVDVATGILPKRPKPVVTPPTPPPAPPPAPPVTVPPVEILGPRRRDIITVQCWVPTCLNQCVVDKDLMRRVTLVPVLKAWSPRGARYEPLLPLPPLFFYSCEEHKESRFGYRSVYDALAYLLFESRSSTKRLTITKGTFVDIGLDQEDINSIQAAEARWIPRS